MKKVIIIIFILVISIVGFSYFITFRKTQFDDNYIDSLNKYKVAQKILFDNKDSIKTNVSYHEFDTLRQIDLPTIFSANKFYFANTLLKTNSNIQELQQLISLWDNHLLADDTSVGQIRLDNDNTVVFNIKFYEGMFFFSPMTFHYIVYDPKHKFINEKSHDPFGVVKSKVLDNDWFYVIASKGFD